MYQRPTSCHRPILHPACLILTIVPACLVALASSAHAEPSIIGRCEEALPIAQVLAERLTLEQASPNEILAGAESQFTFFFPAGLNSSIASRTQIDALVASTLLLEQGLRRGGGDYQQMRNLFSCYFLMYQAGKEGLLSQTFEVLRQEVQGQQSQEDTAAIELYAQSIEGFEEYGNNQSILLGNALIAARPDDTEVVYALAHIAEQSGDYELAARLYQRGLDGERFGRWTLALAEMQATASLPASEETIALALSLDPDLASDVEDLNRRVELRRDLLRLEREQERGRLSSPQRFEMARLLRQSGRVPEAIEIFGSLSDWSEAPAELAEEYAIALMEANLPTRMREVMEATRGLDPVSPRQLQLRLVADSLDLVSAVAGASAGLRLSEFLESEQGSGMRSDLEAFASLDPARAQVVRVYLELVTALVSLRMSGSLDPEMLASIHGQVDELVRDQPDNVAGHRFGVMLSLYEQDRQRLTDVLDRYGAYCREHDCQQQHRRIASMILLQIAAKEGEPALVDEVERLLREWPSGEQGPLYHLASGTARILRAQFENATDSQLTRVFGQARESFLAGIEAGVAGLPGVEVTAADYTGLYNNLAFLAQADRDPVAASLYLYAARRYAPSQPVILLNLGVCMAARQNVNDAFVTLSLGASEALLEPALTFQLLRWAGHIYNLAGQTAPSVDAYSRALALYEAGQDWAASVDDGVFQGGPVQWGLLYDDDPDEEGLVVTLDLAAPPMFFTPAPVSVLEMSAAVEGATELPAP